MEILMQEGSLTTPKMVLDHDQGVIELSGKSIPENSIEFYEPLNRWLDQYIESPQSKTVVNLSMEYFNTSSSKEFMRFFRRLEQLHKSGKTQMLVRWYYELDDEEMLEMGEGLMSNLGIPFEIIPMKEFLD